MNYDQWIEQFQPIKNTISNREEMDGTLFETFKEDLAHVQSQAANLTVWTWVDCDGVDIIQSNMTTINRVGYFITEVPHNGHHIELKIFDDDDDTDADEDEAPLPSQSNP